MKVLKVGISMGLQGCEIEDEIAVDDNASPAEVEAEVRDWAMERIEWWFVEK